MKVRVEKTGKKRQLSRLEGMLGVYGFDDEIGDFMATDLQFPVFTNNSEDELAGRWGMVIDQDICTGCQACVAACAMENNVPFVGEEDAGYGRSMHWIRIERFWDGALSRSQDDSLSTGDVPAMS